MSTQPFTASQQPHPFHLRRKQRRTPCLPALGALALLAGAWAAPAAAADFITSNRTLAGGNPLNGSYIGSQVIVGLTPGLVQVPGVQVDVVSPALFSYSDQTGGGLRAVSNSVVRVQGGTFNQISPTGFGGGLDLHDTATGTISGGTLRAVSVSGAAAGAAGAHAHISGGLIENGSAGVAYIVNGTLHVSGGTLRATGGQSAIAGGIGSVIEVSGGAVQSVLGAGAYIAQNSQFTMTGGSVSGGPGGGGQWGVRLEGANLMAQLQGGTVNGGVRADAYNFQTALQAALGGSLAVNGGVFAHNNAALDVTGGTYTRFAGADASFFALGSNTINFYGSGLALSGPTAGDIFETNPYSGNFYTFTSGTFADGQSAVGLRVFDALSIVGNPLTGGFTLNNVAAVPEPGTWLMMLMALPALGAMVRRRSTAP